MDNQLVEQVVQRHKGVRYRINVFLILLGAVAIPGICIALAYIIDLPYLIYLALFIFMFCIYGVWYFISSMNVEYEYAFLPTTLRIDKVISKRKRKPVVKVDVKLFDDFFRYSDAEMGKQRYAKVYTASAREFSTDNYVATYHSDAKGRTAVIFTPDDRLIEAMKPYFSSTLRKKLFAQKKL